MIDPETFKGKIEFEDVWFRYPTRKADWVLKGLNLIIFPNETIALVGESGCGKSTLVSLLLRFYEVDFGDIKLDGVSIKEYNIASLRKQMGLVMQEPTLFNYTITENIIYGKSEATNSEIRESAQIANGLEFIESDQLTNAYEDTAQTLLAEMKHQESYLRELIGNEEFEQKLAKMEKQAKEEKKKGTFVSAKGEIDYRSEELKDMELHPGFSIDCGLKGGKLSGGQKQRVAIARAIIRRPKILILDEATSALDEASQTKVQIALDNVMNDRTSIVIAHRLSTVEKCNRILVLENGRLVEEGGFEELKGKEGGIFAQLASGMANKDAK